MTRKPMSVATKAKISAALRGNKNGRGNKGKGLGTIMHLHQLPASSRANFLRGADRRVAKARGRDARTSARSNQKALYAAVKPPPGHAMAAFVREYGKGKTLASVATPTSSTPKPRVTKPMMHFKDLPSASQQNILAGMSKTMHKHDFQGPGKTAMETRTHLMGQTHLAADLRSAGNSKKLRDAAYRKHGWYDSKGRAPSASTGGALAKKATPTSGTPTARTLTPEQKAAKAARARARRAK